MRILWVSDSPFAPTGYGQLTLLLAPRLRSLGHEIVILAPSHTGRPLSFDGITVIGGRLDPFGNEMLEIAAEREKADCIITFKDPYVYDPGILARLPVPWFPIVPVDTEPLCQRNQEVLQYATRPIAITRNGEQALRDAEFTPYYAPLGTLSDVFVPGDQAAARAEFNWPEQAFVALMVANNNVMPPTRKGFEQAIMAWAQFVDGLPDAERGKVILALHTELSPDRGGIDLEALLTACEVPKHTVHASDGYQYLRGFPLDRMVRLYQACDVLFAPSLGEGFWLPGLEAQLCGRPVISVEWTAQREMTFAGVQIPSAPEHGGGDRLWNAYTGGFWFRARVSSLALALQTAYEQSAIKDPRVGEVARQRAMPYDLNRVVGRYWKPMLEDMASWIAGEIL